MEKKKAQGIRRIRKKTEASAARKRNHAIDRKLLTQGRSCKSGGKGRRLHLELTKRLVEKE